MRLACVIAAAMLLAYQAAPAPRYAAPPAEPETVYYQVAKEPVPTPDHILCYDPETGQPYRARTDQAAFVGILQHIRLRQPALGQTGPAASVPADAMARIAQSGKAYVALEYDALRLLPQASFGETLYADRIVFLLEDLPGQDGLSRATILYLWGDDLVWASQSARPDDDRDRVLLRLIHSLTH
ncbi:MAG: hypothetical protein ACOYJA_11030 [Christensenellales bacterium]|jgi:hypothetical protein